MTVEETRMSDMNIFLQETESIDYSNPIITKQINLLNEKSTSNIDYIKNAYEFVRDKISHSWDVKTNLVSKNASEVLINKTGIC
ncbi:MAG: transglutaminase, partial [Spirochaetia bacterium]|nr:transglutaminase [Spirochaetia bacterium]